MIKFQNTNVIVHEITNTKDVINIEGVSFQPQPGDLDKYSQESIDNMQGKDWVWYKGYATGFDPETFYILEYLTGDYIGVGVSSKESINSQYAKELKELEVETLERGNE